jgi:DNA helicase-2/ATP-dependent DNA helicase PcrA
MIARRLGFADLNRLFTGEYASSRAQDAFESGEHFLLKPFLSTICPLIAAHEQGDARMVINLLRRESPAFAVDGFNAEKSLKVMVQTSSALVSQLQALWRTETIGAVLRFCIDNQIVQPSERLSEHLDRAPRDEAFDEDLHSLDKGDWLADSLIQMPLGPVAHYAEYIANNTAYSTQHGVKGEEYEKVMVVYDDVEAAWNNYSFNKVLTPLTAGEPTDRQLSITQKLAYVSFSRAKEDLRVLMFTANPEDARTELINSKLLMPDQIRIAA